MRAHAVSSTSSGNGVRSADGTKSARRSKCSTTAGNCLNAASPVPSMPVCTDHVSHAGLAGLEHKMSFARAGSCALGSTYKERTRKIQHQRQRRSRLAGSRAGRAGQPWRHETRWPACTPHEMVSRAFARVPSAMASVARPRLLMWHAPTRMFVAAPLLAPDRQQNSISAVMASNTAAHRHCG